MGAVGRSETGHRDAENVAARESQLVERADGYQQGERRIEPAGDTDDGRMRAGMPDALRQSADLDAEDFFAALLHLLRIVRDERARIETAFDRKLFAVGAQGDRDAFAERAAAVGCKGIGFAPQGQQPFDVRFRYGQLFFEREAFRFVQKDSVFGDQAVAGENHVGRRFAESGRAVQVSRQRAGRLLGDQRTEISVLADHFVACRQIDQQGGPGHCEAGGRRVRNPQIFADFDTETDFPVFEKQVGRERNLLSAQFDRFAVGFRAGGEPARFVKFVVIRQVSLRHDSENDAGAEYDGRIVEPVVDSQRHTGDTDRPAGGRVGEQPCESPFGLFDQERLAEQVAAGVSGDAELRKCRDGDALPVGFPNQSGDSGDVMAAIPRLHARCGGCDFQKSEVHTIRAICPVQN